LSQREYSASTLEMFAACPYRFHLAAIQMLRPAERPRPVHRIPPDVRGRIFHSAVYRYTRTVIERSVPDLETKLTLADQAVYEVARAEEEKIAPALPAVWRAGVDSIRADLRSWIVVREASIHAWRPIAAELSFGIQEMAGTDPASSAEPIRIDDLVKLRGAIDLVEESSTGTIRVVDHKTGKKHRYRLDAQGSRSFYELQAVGAGETLQPLLYALAAEKLMDKKAAEARLSYSTVRGGFEEEVVYLNSRTRSMLAQVLNTIDDHLRQGWLPAFPRLGACAYCDYRSLCGPYEEERTAAKPPIEGLVELRGLP
jgi:RecB family exonuclease